MRFSYMKVKTCQVQDPISTLLPLQATYMLSGFLILILHTYMLHFYQLPINECVMNIHR